MQSVFEAKAMLFGFRLMQDFSLSEIQAAGVFGNLGHESGGFKLLQELKPTIPGSRGGYGWAQWTGPRRRSFEAWCKTQKLIPSTDEASYGYLCYELRGPESGAIAALKHQTTLDGATDAFCREFERPGVVALKSRMVWAKRALAAIQKGVAANAVEVKRATTPPPPKPAPKPTVLAKKAKSGKRKG